MKFKKDDRVRLVNSLGANRLPFVDKWSVLSVHESPDGPLYFMRWDNDAPGDSSFCYQDVQLKQVEPIYARIADEMRKKFEEFSKIPIPDHVLFGMFTDATALVKEEERLEKLRNPVISVQETIKRYLWWYYDGPDEPERSVRTKIRPVNADDMIDLVNVPIANVMISEHARHLWVCTPSGTVLRIKADKITLDDRRISKDD